MIKKSLALRVLALSFILIALPILIESFIIFTNSYEKSLQESEQKLVRISLEKAPEILRLAASKRQLLRELEDLLKFEDRLSDLPDDSLNKTLDTLKQTGQFSEMAFLELDNTGRYICKASSSPEYIGADYSTAVDYQQLVELGSYVYPTYEDYTLDKVFYIGIQIYKDKEIPIGVFMVRISLSDALQVFLKPLLDIYPINFALLTSDYIVFAASDPALELQLLKPVSPIRRAQIIEMEQFEKLTIPTTPIKVYERPGYPFFEFEFYGERQLAYIQPLQIANLNFMAYAEQHTLFGPEFLSLLRTYATYAVVLLIGAAITYWLTVRMTKPMNHLTSVMHDVQKGNYNARYQQDPLGFEINSLGEMFNQMIYSLINQMKRVEEERVDKEIYMNELKIGQEVQLSLLPQHMPYISGIELAEVYIPAKEVGGDFFDVYVKNEKSGQESLILTVADASGKGISACLYALGVRSMLRTFAKDHDNISTICQLSNDLFMKDTGDSGMFVTVLMSRYNISTKELRYFSCGHVPGLVRRLDGTVIPLAHSGMALGLMPFQNIHEESLELLPGDIVVFYSDGIIEAHNEKDQMFSETRLINLLRQRKWVTAREIADGIVSEMKEFVGNAIPYDDITLLVMRINE